MAVVQKACTLSTSTLYDQYNNLVLTVQSICTKLKPKGTTLFRDAFFVFSIDAGHLFMIILLTSAKQYLCP